MKKLIIYSGVLFMFSCNNAEKNDGNSNNRETNIEANSGENISPQLENDGSDRLQVDTINNSQEAKSQADDNNLHK